MNTAVQLQIVDEVCLPLSSKAADSNLQPVSGASSRDRVQTHGDLMPTDDFVDGSTHVSLKQCAALLKEFEQTLSGLSAEDEFDTALIVDNQEEVSRLLRTNSNMQFSFPYSKLFALSIEHGKSPRIVKLCLEKGADVNAADVERNQSTPLISAIRNRALPHVWQVLLDSQANVERGDALMSPLQYAILYNKLELIQALKKAGANINVIDPRGNRGSPLRFAITMRCIEPALELLEMGADPSGGVMARSLSIDAGASSSGLSSHTQALPLLHHLCLPPVFDQEAELITALVRHGADLEQRDRVGRTALLLAVHESRLVVVQTLHKLGADIHAVDERGQNALLTLVKSPMAVSNLELCAYLLVAKVDALLLPKTGWSAIGWIEKLGRDRIGDMELFHDLARVFRRYNIIIELPDGDIGAVDRVNNSRTGSRPTTHNESPGSHLPSTTAHGGTSTITNTNVPVPPSSNATAATASNGVTVKGATGSAIDARIPSANRAGSLSTVAAAGSGPQVRSKLPTLVVQRPPSAKVALR